LPRAQAAPDAGGTAGSAGGDITDQGSAARRASPAAHLTHRKLALLDLVQDHQAISVCLARREQSPLSRKPNRRNGANGFRMGTFYFTEPRTSVLQRYTTQIVAGCAFRG
jgi:hypothetical protein